RTLRRLLPYALWSRPSREHWRTPAVVVKARDEVLTATPLPPFRKTASLVKTRAVTPPSSWSTRFGLPNSRTYAFLGRLRRAPPIECCVIDRGGPAAAAAATTTATTAMQE